MSDVSNETEGRYSFETPEQLSLGYDVAGLGSRCLAALVDTFLLLIMIFTMALFGFIGVALLLEPIAEFFGFSSDASTLTVVAFIILLNFGIIWGYYVFFEFVWNGQTPGKRIVGLRVIKQGGYPLQLTDSVVRNVIRLLDFLPVYYVVGATVMLIDRHSRRLGDLAAGTLVVKERRDLTLESLPTATMAGPAPATAPVLRPVHAHRTYDLARLTPHEQTLLREYAARRSSFTPEAAEALSTKLATAFAQKLGHKLNGEQPELFLEDLLQQVRGDGTAP